MINEIRIVYYKSLKQVTVRLNRLTVFVGPNGAGKSSVLQAVNYVCQSRVNFWSAISAKMQGLVSKGFPIDEMEFTVKIETPDTQFAYCLIPFNSMKLSGSASSPVVPTGPEGGTRHIAADIDSESWKPVAISNLAVNVPSSTYLQLESSKLAVSDYGTLHQLCVMSGAEYDSSVLYNNGLNVHTVLANMCLNDPVTWHVLQDDLNAIIGSVARIRLTPYGPNSPASLLFDMSSGIEGLTIGEVSEGTQLVLALLAALHGPARPDVLLLDDIDRGLHPKAQADLVKLLRRLLDVHPELQILATTHSPYLLDSLEPDEVRMTCLRDDGTTACAPISDHPEFKKWKGEMAPGEMWSFFGERWMLAKEAKA